MSSSARLRQTAYIVKSPSAQVPLIGEVCVRYVVSLPWMGGN